MLCTAVSLLLIELVVVYAELRVSDILNAELLPSTLLLEGNVTRRSFTRRSPIGFPEALRRKPGNWSQAFPTMEFHRKMMNEFLCRNYVAEQILDDMATSGESSSAWTSPLRSSGPVKKDITPEPFSLTNKTTENFAEDRMDTEETVTETPAEENVSTTAPGLAEVARSAPMFRKKSTASLKKTRKKKKKNGERGSRRRTDITKPNMLADTGSAAYKDWLTRTALLEDIYRHYDHLAVPSEDSPVPSPAPVEENISEEIVDTNTGINMHPLSASDTISSGAGGQIISNLAAYAGGEVTGYAVTQGTSYPGVASPPSAATIAAASAAATAATAATATNQGVAGIMRPVIHTMPTANGPIPEATSAKGLSALASPSLLSTSSFPLYGARFPVGSGFSFPASAGLPGFSGFPTFTALPSQPTPVQPTGLPTAAYGERGGAFSHHGDSHVEYELPAATSPEDEYHHHHHVEHEHHKGHGKLLSLEDLFDLVLTAIAFLAFGAFIVHLIMCLLNSGQSSYVPMMEVPVTAPGQPQVPPNTGAAAAAQSDTGRRRRRRRRRDAVSGEAGFILDGVAPAALDRAAASVITSIDAALLHIRESEKSEIDQSECLLRALCAHNRRSRSAPGMLRVWMPVWSLGLSWVVGRNTTYPAGSTLANLRAALLGLSGTRCRSAFPKCSLPSTVPTAPSTKQPTPSTRQSNVPIRHPTFSTKQLTPSTKPQTPSTRQPTPSTLDRRPSATATPTHPAPPLTTAEQYPGPPGVGGYSHFTPIAIKSNRRRVAVKRRRKKP